MVTRIEERARLGPLETEDRLLEIADREDRAGLVSHAPTFGAPFGPFARDELLGERFQDVPLHGAGILPFIDQHMIDATIELVEHPGRDARSSQQIARGENEIVEIKRGGQGLQGTEPLREIETQNHQGG